MKPRRSELQSGGVRKTLLVLALSPGALAAQGRLEGATELVIPVGARSIGAGYAMVADQPGLEAVWWNPAGLGWVRRREIALLYGSGLYTSNVLAAAFPRAPIGVPALSVHLVDLGEQESIPRGGTTPTGLILARTLVYTASFATTFGARTSAGLNFKLYQARSDCSGVCEDLPEHTPQTSAIDAGVQYRALSDSAPLWIGFAMRNLGQSIQTRDAEQSDPIPTRYHLGASYAPAIRALPPGLRLRGSAELVKSPNLPQAGARAGLTVSWENRAFARVGYVKGEGESGSGPSLGLGLATGRLRIDLARLVGGTLVIGTESPTYLSLSYVF